MPGQLCFENCGWTPPSQSPLDAAHVMNAPKPSLFSPLFHFCVLLSMQTKEQKRGRLGNKATPPLPVTCEFESMAECT